MIDYEKRIKSLEKWCEDHLKEGIEYGEEFELRDAGILNRLDSIDARIKQLLVRIIKLENKQINYDKIHHCLMHIINECDNGDNSIDAIESILHTAKHALKLIEETEND